MHPHDYWTKPRRRRKTGQKPKRRDDMVKVMQTTVNATGETEPFRDSDSDLVTKDSVTMYDSSDKRANLKEGRYAVIFAQIPEGFHLATEEEMEKTQPKGTKYWAEQTWRDVQNGGGGNFITRMPYAYIIPDTPKRIITFDDGKTATLSEESYIEMHKHAK